MESGAAELRVWNAPAGRTCDAGPSVLGKSIHTRLPRESETRDINIYRRKP
ncbi:hypothetical protein TVNIR_0260 [Thioalkalivibrio nitratireducens DSM 14787]|uniref:Uncharacterized protein n=1 Tax=Thioalkalivibrio nitratireducens (strain DSM 14787 / UNIQEM 213 / ALEN2) TaxID=1255043 RepID=L0DUF4_THIND|nr:hypothetical protein TVNIR_0260 [Thioalkalivibrio nitratireducens DSM 14787]